MQLDLVSCLYQLYWNGLFIEHRKKYRWLWGCFGGLHVVLYGFLSFASFYVAVSLFHSRTMRQIRKKIVLQFRSSLPRWRLLSGLIHFGQVLLRRNWTVLEMWVSSLFFSFSLDLFESPCYNHCSFVYTGPREVCHDKAIYPGICFKHWGCYSWWETLSEDVTGSTVHFSWKFGYTTNFSKRVIMAGKPI